MVNQNMRMIDVTTKKETERLAIAKACIHMRKEMLTLIKKGKVPKGEVLSVAQTAGIMAAKRTPDLIPLCHPLLLTSVTVDFTFPEKGDFLEIIATVKGKGKTGFEMEALTAVSFASLTIYDMCKMLDKNMTITDIRLVKKMGGKSGTHVLK